jgi:hypothetical protein
VRKHDGTERGFRYALRTPGKRLASLRNDLSGWAVMAASSERQRR